MTLSGSAEIVAVGHFDTEKLFVIFIGAGNVQIINNQDAVQDTLMQRSLQCRAVCLKVIILITISFYFRVFPLISCDNLIGYGFNIKIVSMRDI